MKKSFEEASKEKQKLNDVYSVTRSTEKTVERTRNAEYIGGNGSFFEREQQMILSQRLTSSLTI
ncbi:hypothetical protein ACFPCW_18865 [Vibrio thalassae]|uniref:hypothetical protein n=1 Tax=Vibrio thalassae TaxID=1243014 RepID=UPI00360FBFB1